LLLEVLEDAVILADVHYSKLRDDNFEKLLIEFHKNPPKQIFLLGDIFETLFGGVEYTIETNKNIIQLLENLGKKSEIFFFEGNHDFNLTNVFRNLKVIPISEQPFAMRFKDKKVLFAHGDWNESFSYKIYRHLVEKPLFLKIVSTLDFQNSLIKHIEKSQLSKEKCREKENFQDLIAQKMRKLNCDVLIEGHYHQGKIIKFDNKTYVNIPPFLCKKEVKIFKDLIY
jgi:UDP-2,3-diacylglucosamine hydrolase